jgi:hypothetical protein
MKTLRKMIFKDVITTVAFVTLAFLALFFFFDLLDEMRCGPLRAVRRPPGHAGGAAGSAQPPVRAAAHHRADRHHLRDGPPGAKLGIHHHAHQRPGPWLALRTLVTIGAGFVVLLSDGDYIAPLSERAASATQAKFQGGTVTSGATGAWLKERKDGRTLAINVRNIRDDELLGVRIFEFDADGRMLRQIHAEKAEVKDNDLWKLSQVRRSEFSYPEPTQARLQRSPKPNTTRHQPHLQHGGRGRAQARSHAHHRAVPLHPAPAEQRPVGAEVRDRVLAQGVLPAELPGDGGAGPAFCLPAFPLRRHGRLCVRRCDGRHQLLPAQQRLRLRRQPAELAPC